jgi:hypothetical protein
MCTRIRIVRLHTLHPYMAGPTQLNQPTCAAGAFVCVCARVAAGSMQVSAGPSGPSGNSLLALSYHSKRRLIPSHKLAYKLVTPFILWGITVIAVNLVGYFHLKVCPAAQLCSAGGVHPARAPQQRGVHPARPP